MTQWNKACEADKRLQRALLSPKMHALLQQDPAQFAGSAAVLPNVSMTLGEWAGQIKPIPIDDISSAFRLHSYPLYTDVSYRATLFSDVFHPVQKQWMPRKPNQVAPPGFNPACMQDLYEPETTVFTEHDEAFKIILHDLQRYNSCAEEPHHQLPRCQRVFKTTY